MPLKKRQVKIETRVPKVTNTGRLKDRGLPLSRSKRTCSFEKETESSSRGREKHITNVSLVSIPCDDQSRREKLSKKLEIAKVTLQPRVPVISITGIPLMPCHQARANELIRKGKALRRFTNGIFYIKLLEREDGNVQEVSCGIDPGSIREGFTVKSEKYTYVNILSDAVNTVKDKLEVRRNMRRSRRFRKTPCRKNKYNRKRNKAFLPPSTKARWQAKLRIVNILRKIYPIQYYVVEDVQAKNKKGQRKWNKSFSPLEIGKKWFYDQLANLGGLILKQGFETANMRKELGLVKTKNKIEEVFSAHNVDSWVLANSVFMIPQRYPDNERIIRFVPLNFYRRQLHVLKPAKGEVRKNYGGTLSLGIVRGTVVKNKKYGLVYVGGASKGRLSIHDMGSGKRLSQKIKIKDIEELYKIKWMVQNLLYLKTEVSLYG